ncbi:MAG: sensor domain-containing diguanylate cyclase [Azospirillaceae bacterium]|nr:sensor domain-containing diguanylate cyclase [Azospirillaceae bacterium]
METETLTRGGEFVDLAHEAEYRSQNVPVWRGHVRLVFQYTALVALLFCLGDWKFWRDPHLCEAVIAHAVVVIASILCLKLASSADSFARLQLVCLIWAVPVIGASAVLIIPHTAISLFIALVLPATFYLALPLCFRGALAVGLACSAAALAATLVAAPLSDSSLGLLLAMVTLNVILVAVLIRSNRLRRLQWASTRLAHAANQDLSEHREMLRHILRAIPTPLFVTEKNSGKLTQINDSALSYFGEVASMESFVDTFSIDNHLDRRDLARLAMILETRGRVVGFETRIHLPDGTSRNVLLAAAAIEIGGTETILTVLTDITARKEMEARLERLATTDSLTGLLNRAQFFAIAATEIKRAQRHQRPIAVIMIDIDYFKRINDNHGHDVGDRTLKALAALCRGLVRDHDIVARLGGEEFGLLLPETEQRQALALADRLRVAIETASLDGLATPITISVGVADVRLGEMAVDAALSRADQALYVAKRAGRNRAVHFEIPESLIPRSTVADIR